MISLVIQLNITIWLIWCSRTELNLVGLDWWSVVLHWDVPVLLFYCFCVWINGLLEIIQVGSVWALKSPKKVAKEALHFFSPFSTCIFLRLSYPFFNLFIYFYYQAIWARIIKFLYFEFLFLTAEQVKDSTGPTTPLQQLLAESKHAFCKHIPPKRHVEPASIY